MGPLLLGFSSSCSSHASRVVDGALVLFLAGTAGTAGSVAAYRRITGVWWDGRTVGPVQERVRRTVRRWAVGYVVLTAPGAAEFLLDLRGAMVVLGAVLGASAGLLGRWVTRNHVAGLRAGR